MNGLQNREHATCTTCHTAQWSHFVLCCWLTAMWPIFFCPSCPLVHRVLLSAIHLHTLPMLSSKASKIADGALRKEEDTASVRSKVFKVGHHTDKQNLTDLHLTIQLKTFTSWECKDNNLFIAEYNHWTFFEKQRHSLRILKSILLEMMCFHV